MKGKKVTRTEMKELRDALHQTTLWLATARTGMSDIARTMRDFIPDPVSTAKLARKVGLYHVGFLLDIVSTTVAEVESMRQRVDSLVFLVRRATDEVPR